MFCDYLNGMSKGTLFEGYPQKCLPQNIVGKFPWPTTRRRQAGLPVHIVN